MKVKSLSRVQLFATPWTVPARLLHPWDFPGKNVAVGCHFLLQGIFPTQGSNLSLLHCRQTLYHLSHQGATSRYFILFDSVINGIVSLISLSESLLLVYRSATLVRMATVKKSISKVSLTVQWLRTCLPRQGTWVQSLTQEDPMWCRATKPIRHNYWALLRSNRSHDREKPSTLTKSSLTMRESRCRPRAARYK